MTVKQAAWWYFVAHNCVSLLIFGAMGEWLVWGVMVLGTAVYTEMRLRWIRD